jgi:hypothetical protein
MKNRGLGAIGFGRPAVAGSEGDPVFGRSRGDEGVIDGTARDAEFRQPPVESFRPLGAEES